MNKTNGKSNGEKKPVRCAIYTRKSTEEGLQQEFNTLDAQRESAEAYIAAQRHEGWVCNPDRYDDGGFTGGNLDRPAMQRLLADIEAGKVDCVVVYKVDRLSRSLMDFARIMQTFDKHEVSFVSVTQAFNTTHSMGRLTLNILLSFAQFERELISERTRDKIAAARRKGKFAGGKPILGYDLLSSPAGPKLVVNDEETIQVRGIFELYLKHQALIPVVKEMDKRGWHTCPTKSVPAGEIEQFVIDQIKAIGKDPAVLAETVRQVRGRGKKDMADLQAEERGLAKQLGRLNVELARLATGGTKGGDLAATQDRIREAEQRATVVRERVVALSREMVDEREVASALSVFSPVWETLGPREQARVIQLLVERVDYDGSAGTVSVTFRANGIKTLAQQKLREAA